MVMVAVQQLHGYTSLVSLDPAALPNDIDALKRIIGELTRDAVAARAEIEKLRFQLGRFKRAQFGRSSEQINRTSSSSNWPLRRLMRTMRSGSRLSPLLSSCSGQQANKPPKQHGGRCPTICRARRLSIPAPAAVRTAAALCAGSAPT
jgi:hypothetical protein